MATLYDLELDEERAKVEAWRICYALKLGYPRADADRIACDARIDLHHLEYLIGKGASLEQALRIEIP